MINHTILSELHTELGQVMAKAASFERQLESESEHNYGRLANLCLLYTSPSPRDRTRSRMPSSA